MTIIELPSGDLYGTNKRSPKAVQHDLEARGWLVQRLGNLVIVKWFVSQEWAVAHGGK